jgi:hypothetical protein
LVPEGWGLTGCGDHFDFAELFAGCGGKSSGLGLCSFKGSFHGLGFLIFAQSADVENLAFACGSDI